MRDPKRDRKRAGGVPDVSLNLVCSVPAAHMKMRRLREIRRTGDD